ncbi:hypothetical protein MesoLj131b_70780 (plasmid) [Mesorhizobium sp. 131-2-5]|nr:hypothetical protein MesoLj131b_70780 [Mesorhizobium sp. 131-2-5]
MAQISPLRQRMIEDLTIRNLSPETQRSYVHHVAKFSRFFGRSPDQLAYEEVRAYQAHLVGRRVSWGALNQTVCALRFLYGVTLGRSDLPARQHRDGQARLPALIWARPLNEPGKSAITPKSSFPAICSLVIGAPLVKFFHWMS